VQGQQHLSNYIGSSLKGQDYLDMNIRNTRFQCICSKMGTTGETVTEARLFTGGGDWAGGTEVQRCQKEESGNEKKDNTVCD